MKTKKAIFLDRDGTIIIDKNYLSRVEDIEYFTDSLSALKILQKLGFQMFIVTNQSGVGRGYFTLERVHEIHQQIQKDLRSFKISAIKDFAICPHSPDDGCDCRKPSGKMIKELMKKHGISPEGSYMVGDKLIDVEAGKDAGLEGVLIRSTENPQKGLKFKNLLEFAKSLE